jgi:hypothetical protein
MPDIAASLTDAVLTKQCSRCGLILPLTMFYSRKINKDGLQGRCKQCMNKGSTRWEKENPVKVQTMYMVCAARNRAKKRGWDFNIDADYVRSFVVSNCPILGMPLEWSCCRGDDNKLRSNSPSLDRIDSTKGYVRGNVWIISHRANCIKSNATHEELKLVTKAMGEALVKSLEF